MDKEKYIAVFECYSHTTLMYTKLYSRGIYVEMISTPSKISIGCTKAIVFYSEDIEKIQEEIRINYLSCKGIFAKVLYKDIETFVLI